MQMTISRPKDILAGEGLKRQEKNASENVVCRSGLLQIIA